MLVPLGHSPRRPLPQPGAEASTAPLSSHSSSVRASPSAISATLHSCWTVWGRQGCVIIIRADKIYAVLVCSQCSIRPATGYYLMRLLLREPAVTEVESGSEMWLTYKSPVRPSKLLYQHGPQCPTLPDCSEASLLSPACPRRHTASRFSYSRPFAQVIPLRRNKILRARGLVAPAYNPSYSRGQVMKITNSSLVWRT